MSHYKHTHRAIQNALLHLKQAQECVADLDGIDKEACGSWGKELKEVEKMLNRCCRKIEIKHNKTNKNTKTASLLFNTEEDTDKELNKISELIELAIFTRDEEWETALRKELKTAKSLRKTCSCCNQNICASCDCCKNEDCKDCDCEC